MSGPIALRAAAWIARVGPVRELLRRRHAAQARAIGLERVHLVLSFDCDTDADADVVVGVAERLRRSGIVPAFAVPGAQLQRASAPYRTLAARGHEILAHGARPHTILRSGRYESVLFYHDLDDAAVANDISMSTRAVRETIGVSPAGFRAPHFGTLGSRRLGAIRQHLAREGYVFSSSTLPLRGILSGPVHLADGLYEIPLSGCADAPLAVLDSFNFRFAPGHPADPNAYVRALVGGAAWYVALGLPALVNTYADPSQVHDWPPFWAAIDELVRLGVRPLSFAGLLELVAPSLRPALRPDRA